MNSSMTAHVVVIMPLGVVLFQGLSGRGPLAGEGFYIHRLVRMRVSQRNGPQWPFLLGTGSKGMLRWGLDVCLCVLSKGSSSLCVQQEAPDMDNFPHSVHHIHIHQTCTVH
jgi:hypothetical protein